MLWPRKRFKIDTKITWHLTVIALSMIAASILAVSNIPQKRIVEPAKSAGLSDRGIENLAEENNPVCFSTAIFRICAEHGVPPRLVHAIIQVESQGNPKAVSRKGAMGLMQLMPEMITVFRLADPFDPLANIDAGVRHLKYLLIEYSGNLSLTLAAYNAGPGAVRKYRGIPPYPETKKYLRKVLKEYQRERNEGHFPAPVRTMQTETGENGGVKQYVSAVPPQFVAFSQLPAPSSKSAVSQ
jgi:soluble lytic murein transglycosylase-like protein